MQDLAGQGCGLSKLLFRLLQILQRQKVFKPEFAILGRLVWSSRWMSECQHSVQTAALAQKEHLERPSVNFAQVAPDCDFADALAAYHVA